VGAVRRLLIVCGEPLGERMAGPAIRALELGRAVAAAGIAVTIAAPQGQGPAPLALGMRQVPLTRRELGRALGADGERFGALPLEVDPDAGQALDAGQVATSRAGRDSCR